MCMIISVPLDRWNVKINYNYNYNYLKQIMSLQSNVVRIQKLEYSILNTMTHWRELHKYCPLFTATLSAGY